MLAMSVKRSAVIVTEDRGAPSAAYMSLRVVGYVADKAVLVSSAARGGMPRIEQPRAAGDQVLTDGHSTERTQLVERLLSGFQFSGGWGIPGTSTAHVRLFVHFFFANLQTSR